MITLYVKELKAQLAVINSVVERKTTIPILSYARITAAGFDISIAGTDLDTSYVGTLKGTTTKGEQMLIDPHLLANIARTTEAETLTIEREEARIVIKADRSEWSLLDLKVDDFPALPSVSPVEVTIDGDNFRRALKFSKYAATRELSRFTLSGAKTLIDNELRMVATDGHRLTYYKAPEAGRKGMDLVDFFLDRGVMDVCLKMKAYSYGISTDATRVFIKTDNGCLSARKGDGKFPDYEMVLPNAKTLVGSATFAADALLKACRQAKFSCKGERASAMLLAVTGDTVQVTAVNRWHNETYNTQLPATSTGQMAFAFNYDYLADFLVLAGRGEIKLSWVDGNAATEWTFVEEFGYKYKMILMPLRM